MPVYRLPRAYVFPPPDHAEPGGLLAVGGDVAPGRLLEAYRHGIFPWYSEGEPIWWHSPDPRCVIEPAAVHVPRTLRPVLNQRRYEVRFDTAFDAVTAACARVPRPGQRGTWITRSMRRTYRNLFEAGLAHSIEAWRDGELVGGQFGVSIGGMWFGESMFHLAPDASKVTFVVLARWLVAHGVELVDCQVKTPHMERFGAVEWPRTRYLERLAELVERPTCLGPWVLAPDDPARGVG